MPKEKFALDWPAGISTVIGSISARGLAGSLVLVDISTSLPSEGAGVVRVTLPVAVFPAVMVLGFMLIDFTAMPVVTVTVPCAVLFPSVAVVVTRLLLRTNKFCAVPWKVAVVAPAATVTLLGILRIPVWSSLKPTTEPPDGAGPLRVTVPVVVPPLGMLDGLNVTDETVGPHPPPVFGVSL